MAEKIEKPAMQLQRSLPDDIIFNVILVRLPVRTLLKFTRVSKSWKARIKSPAFIRAHYHHHRIPDETSTCAKLVYMSDPYWHKLPEYTFMLDSPPPTANSLSGRSFGVRIIGSSEGLICFLKDSILYLWNPFVSAMKRIPAGEIPISEDNMDFDFTPRSGETTLGFGCSRGGDHRVVKLLWEASHVAEVEVYSLSKDSWRRIVPPSALEIFLEKKGLPHESYWFYRFELPMVSLDGSIYWLACWDDQHEYNPVYKVVRFDLDEESFEATEAPGSGRLAVVDGRLVLLRFGGEINEEAYVEVYVRLSESESEPSSWAFKDFYLPKEATERVRFEKTTTSGDIFLANRDGTLFKYGCYVGENDLGFKLTRLRPDMGIFRLSNFDLIPMQETLALLDRSTRD